jgi:hypothetical protein
VRGPRRAIIRDVVGLHGGQVASGTPSAGPPVPRRAVLHTCAGLAGLVVVAALAGCSDEAPPAASPPPPAPTADDVAVARARASASLLAASAQNLEASHPELAGVLGAVVADHRAHLAALGAARSPSPSGSPPPRRDVQSLVRAETAAAQDALDDVRVVTPGLAALLARIAAARATHADLLAAKAGLRMPAALRTSSAAPPTPAPPSPAPLPGAAPALPSPSESPSAGGPTANGLSDAARDALAAFTAGEHAAVYAYGVVVALVASRTRDRAREAWSWHMARRDVLEERLLAAGVQPPPAAPAYDLGIAPAATVLAATVEDRLATLGARTVAVTSGPDRSDAAEALVAAARRAAAWRGRGTSLPG